VKTDSDNADVTSAGIYRLLHTSAPATGKAQTPLWC